MVFDVTASTSCTVKRLRTSWNCANQSQVSHHGNILWFATRARGHTPPPTRLLWPTGFLCGWSVGLEFRTACGMGNSFRQSLKMFATYWCIQRIRGFTTMLYIGLKRLFTYLLIFTYMIIRHRVCFVSLTAWNNVISCNYNGNNKMNKCAKHRPRFNQARLEVIAACRVKSRRAATTTQSQYPHRNLPTAG